MEWLAGIGVALGILSGLGAAAAFLAIGGLRGRAKELAASNQELRAEVEDEKRRHTTTRERCDVSEGKVSELEVKVSVMTDVFTAVQGPIASLASAMKADHDLLASHHKEAMSGLEYMFALQIDALRLMGDKRTPARIKGDLRMQDGTGGTPDAAE